MAASIRKIVTFIDETHIEGGKAANSPLILIAVAAVIANPWAGQGFVENLRPAIEDQAPGLGALLTEKITSLAGGGDKIEGYGKAAVVGEAGEVEHGSALIHTLRFGNHYRTAVGAESYLSFTNTRAGANGAIMIPMMHKMDAGMRSHYLTLQFAIPDAPTANEIVIALGASIGGRPHHRIGDRYQDLAEMGKDKDDAPV